jgi:uncharacterized protein (TIGR02118 family)
MTMIKSFTLGKRKPGLTQEEYLVYLKEKHGPLAAKVIPGLRKYAQNHPIILSGFEPEFDNITEMWWDSVEALQNYLNWRQSEEAKVLIEDEKKFSDPSKRIRFFALEHIIVER